MNALQDLQRFAREYESERDRARAKGGPGPAARAYRVADAAVRYLGDRRRRRTKENARQGVGADDVRRLKIHQASKAARASR